MKRSMLVSAVMVLATGCAANLPQVAPPGMPAQVQSAALRIGSVWRYAVHDGFTKLPRDTIEYRVSAAQGNTVTVTVLNGERESTEIYTRDGNWVQRPATNMQVFTYNPAYPAYAFPLAPGKTWESTVVATDPADGRRFPVTIKGAVLGWDRIKVPAGEYDALRIRRFVYLGYWQLAVRGESVIEENDWYVPALSQVARRETISKYVSHIYGGSRFGFMLAGRGGDRGRDSAPRYVQDDWLVYELVSHSMR